MLNTSDYSSDIELIDRVIKGDTDAFENIMKKYSSLVMRIVKKHVPENEIEDLTQNAFLRIYKSLSMYEGKGNFKSWLSSITVRTCYDYWRKAYQSREIPMNSLTEKQQEWLENTMSDESATETCERWLQKEASELLEWALCRLSAEDRMVMELVYLEGYSGKEAAELLGWSLSNVKVRSFRLKKRLKTILQAAQKRL
ncbi:MAG: RNA polymerase sigma factor [Deltaproteobacteria bacterium]|nr:RNA polymerase sigma factor [Deltaproteobacteria bacterium]